MLANLNGGEVIDYYIHDVRSVAEPIGFQSGYTFHVNAYGNTYSHSSAHESFIEGVFESIDSIIDLDFNRVYSYYGSDIDIYSLSYHTEFSLYTVGSTWSMGSGADSWWDIGWKDTGDWYFDMNTIIHEIGHSLGLGHPDGAGFNPNYNQSDTVMSYNISPYGWVNSWTESDISALTYLWGRENDVSYSVGSKYELNHIRDFDGNLHAGAGLAAWDDYQYQGRADLNSDGSLEYLFTNAESGRWASVGSDLDFGDYGFGGDTRVIGIYDDPLVLSGEVEKGSPHDSQVRFQNDLYGDNLRLGSAADVDHDGFGEVFWKTTDGSAYLRSIHHLDGNVKYANYMNYGQMTDYLSQHGHMGDIGSSLGL